MCYLEICGGFFCGSKQDHVTTFLVHLYIQLLDNVEMLKMRSWEGEFGDKCIGEREKEVSILRKFSMKVAGSTAFAYAGGIAAVSHFQGNLLFIVFKTPIVVSSGWDYSSEQKLTINTLNSLCVF